MIKNNRSILSAILVSATVCLLFLFALPPTAIGEEKEDDPRVLEAIEDFETAKEMLAGTTNESEIALWERRLYLAERELANARRLSELSEREMTFNTGRRLRLDQNLRKSLATVKNIQEEDDTVIRSRSDSLKRLADHRTHLASQEFPDTDEGTEKQTAMEARVRNIDTEIQSLMLEEDRADLHHRLRGEARRIDLFLDEYVATPKATARSLLDKARNLSTARKNRMDYLSYSEELQAKLEETATAIELTEERAAGIEESAAIFQDRYRVERTGLSGTRDWEGKRERERRWRRLLQRSKSEGELLETRIELLRTQHTALMEATGVLARGLHLLDAEVQFLEDDFAVFRGRYMRQTLLPLGIILGTVLLYTFFSRLVFPRFLSHENLFVTRRMGGYILLFIIIVMLTVFFLEDLKQIGAFIGIVGAAIVIALQDLCSAFAGWFVIVSCRKIKLGDRVEIDGRRGDVIDIQMLRTTMLELNNWLGVDEPTGRIVVIPNSFIFKNHLFNYSHVHPYIWGRIDITVTFETPATEAHDVLFEILKNETKEEFQAASRGEDQLQQNYGLQRAPYIPKIHTVIADSGVLYSLFYVSHYKRFCATRDRVSTSIVKEFESNPRIEFAYPTERMIPTADQNGFAVSVTKPAAPKAD
ncbi:MAG: mechanosensitive ion channel [Lentisphaerae bacterium]|nr:mechanosensitive ion channel [Lentisphaerota bacterium]